MTISSISHAALFALLVSGSASQAQNADPLSFFPHQVGDRWDHWHSAYGYSSTVLTKDSVTIAGNHYLFYDGSTVPKFKIDSLGRVISNPTFANASVLYDLNADSGFVWQGGPWRWAWVARIESVWIFGQRTASKVLHYNPGHPDTTGWNRFYEEHRLAIGFGRFFRGGEPAWIELLVGCIIAGDTFGTLVSAPLQGPELPKELRLRQNYPNPFNPSTTIEFELPEASTITLRVYDLVGREVATIIEGRFAAGTHRASWDACNQASGFYFGRIQANTTIRTIKMLLMR